MNVDSIESMDSAIERFCDDVEWLIEPDAHAERFVKLLSHCVHSDAEGSDITHRVHLKVSKPTASKSKAACSKADSAPAYSKRLFSERPS